MSRESFIRGVTIGAAILFVLLALLTEPRPGPEYEAECLGPPFTTC